MPTAISARRRGLTRRQLLVRSASTAALAGLGSLTRPYLSRAADRPAIAGIQSGDVASDSAVIWARADRAARMRRASKGEAQQQENGTESGRHAHSIAGVRTCVCQHRDGMAAVKPL